MDETVELKFHVEGHYLLREGVLSIFCFVNNFGSWPMCALDVIDIMLDKKCR